MELAMPTSRLRGLFRLVLPQALYRRVVRYTRDPPIGRFDFGDFRRLEPASDVWGLDRGQPVDRHYIERFMGEFRSDIGGEVLEVGDARYTRQYGGDKVTKSHTSHVSSEVLEVDVVADLTKADHAPSDSFDCIICTQTLQMIYEIDAAVGTLKRILKPEGRLLVTVPGISQISRYDMDHWGDYWRFTTASMKRIFGAHFSPEQMQVRAYGNVLTATAFLQGLAADELSAGELDFHDQDYQLVLGIRAIKGPARLPEA
jgi:SAM-dependent methyltransferase